MKNHYDPGYQVATAATPLPPSCRDEQPRRSAAHEVPRGQSGGNAATKDRRDLCCICAYTADCMHRGTAEQPKLYCELFDVDVPSLAAREGGNSRDGSDQGDDCDVMGGLCCNCENRRNCTLRIPEGDVWHCEEYR